MKHITSKIISFICVICIALTSAVTVFAASNAPEILIKMDKTKKSADISIKNIDTAVYSFQITLKMNSGNMDYTLKCAGDDMYGTTTSENGSLDIYIDSTSMLSGKGEIKLAKLISDREMTIGSRAELIVIDYSMKSASYSNVKVNVSQPSGDNSSGGGGSGGGGGGSSSSGGGNIAGGGSIASGGSIAGGTGLVSGVGENLFEPHSPVTREQMAVITVNFARLCGVELPSNVEETEFADEENIQYWATDAVHAAQRAGIINGRDDNIFAPQDTATRAEVAAIMNRLVKILN